jgi:hypothetical protein
LLSKNVPDHSHERLSNDLHSLCVLQHLGLETWGVLLTRPQLTAFELLTRRVLRLGVYVDGLVEMSVVGI